MNRKKNEKSHDRRKSEGSAEVWRKQKKEKNSARGKQVFVRDENGGHWER